MYRISKTFSAILPLFFFACSPLQPEKSELKSIVEHIRSGGLIRDIERLQTDIPMNSGVEDVLIQADAPVAQEDPCPNVPNPSANASAAEFRSALELLMECGRGFLAPIQDVNTAIFVYQGYRFTTVDPKMSLMELGKLSDFLRLDLNKQKYELRQAFSDSELDELKDLTLKRHVVFASGASALYRAMDLRPNILAKFQHIDRYRVLLGLKETQNDVDGSQTARRLSLELSGSSVEVPGAPLSEILHPYAWAVVLPARGSELKPLNPRSEGLISNLSFFQTQLGNPHFHNSAITSYKNVRDVDNPTLPLNGSPHGDAVRVAFMDTGVDFKGIPELGVYLTSGGDGRVRSGDYSDADTNPWVPNVGEFGHGSSVMASLLTIISHEFPEILVDRKVDIAMWKTRSIRNVLAGAPWRTLGGWENRVSVADALIDQIENADSRSPHVVSISMGFSLKGYLEKIKKSDLIKRSNWLWVMAAGNDGQSISSSQMGCFEDISAAQRPDERILCVGALKKGILDDRVTSYSTWGARVQVYSYESFIDLCPNGTSCAAPAVSAGAVILKAKYPQLTPEQIREVIVETAEERSLPVDGQPVHVRRKVRVFDPTRMMDRAFGVAEGKLLKK